MTLMNQGTLFITLLVTMAMLHHGGVMSFTTPSQIGGRVFHPQQRAPSDIPKTVFCNSASKMSIANTFCTNLLATPKDSQERSGPVVNWSLVRQTVLNQGLVGWTIWTGGYGAAVLAQDADFTTSAALLGVAGALLLISVSRLVETAETPTVADLNLSTNMLVLRLFGDKPQPFTAFAVSSLLGSLTGLAEETTFRGEVLPQLANQFQSLPVGIALSTLLFAVLHVNPLGLLKGRQAALDAAVLVAYQLVTGSVFCGLFLLTHNLAVPIISHAIFDGYVFLGTHLVVTTQMEYAQNQALMPVAADRVEAKWRRERGDEFLMECKETFYLADSNRDGVLSRQELRIALYSYGIRLTPDESETVARTADADDSGTIDFPEFLEFVGPTGSAGKAIKSSLLGTT